MYSSGKKEEYFLLKIWNYVKVFRGINSPFFFIINVHDLFLTFRQKYFQQFKKRRPGVNFINMLTCSFYPCRSQKCKNLQDLTIFFALFGPAWIKGAHRMLMKSTSGVDPTNFVFLHFLIFAVKLECLLHMEWIH